MNRLLLMIAALVAAAISLVAADVPKSAVVADRMDSRLANRSVLKEARGRVELPPGVVHLDQALALTGKNAGLTLVGNGTTLHGHTKQGDYIERGALSVRDTAAYSFYEPRRTDEIMPAGQVGWLFNPIGDNWFRQGPIQRILPGERIPAADEKDRRAFMRGHRAVPFEPIRAGATRLQTPAGHPFAVGETVLLTDGPLINELRTEYRRIKSTTAKSVEIDAKAATAYKSGAILGGDWPRDITFRGITFTGDMGPVFLGPAVDLTFEDCTFARNAHFPANSGWLSVSGCARCSFVRCKIDCGMTITSSHDIQFRECSLPLLVSEQGVRRVTFDKCTIGTGHYFDARIYSTDWTIRDCTFTQTLVGFYDGYQVSNCKVTGPANVYVRGGRSSVRNLVSDVPILVQAVYEGAPDGAGKNISLHNITAPSIHCEKGSTGTITGRKCPVTGDLTGWKITPRQ